MDINTAGILSIIPIYLSIGYICLLLLLLLILYVLFDTENKRAKKWGEFMEMLFKGIENGSISSVVEVENLYKGLYNVKPNDNNYRNNLCLILQKLLFLTVYLDSIHSQVYNDRNYHPYSGMKEKLIGFINELENCMPKKNENIIKSDNVLKELESLTRNDTKNIINKKDIIIIAIALVTLIVNIIQLIKI